MEILVLDARVVYDLALDRNRTSEEVRNIIDGLTSDYEIKVSSLIKGRLEYLLGIDKAEIYINCFSDFFFDVDRELLLVIKEIDILDHYSAVEAAYTQIHGDAFIVTTCPESFIGSGLLVFGDKEVVSLRDRLELESIYILGNTDSSEEKSNDLLKYKKNGANHIDKYMSKMRQPKFMHINKISHVHKAWKMTKKHKLIDRLLGPKSIDVFYLFSINKEHELFLLSKATNIKLLSEANTSVLAFMFSLIIKIVEHKYYICFCEELNLENVTKILGLQEMYSSPFYINKIMKFPPDDVLQDSSITIIRPKILLNKIQDLDEWFLRRTTHILGGWVILDSLLDNDNRLVFQTLSNPSSNNVCRGRQLCFDVFGRRFRLFFLISIFKVCEEYINIEALIRTSNSGFYLPPNLELILLSDVNDIEYSINSYEKDCCIKLPVFRVKKGELFHLQVRIVNSIFVEKFIF